MAKSDFYPGARFGRLVVIKFLHKDFVEVVCDCGNKKIVLGKNMKRGLTTSCGCYKKELRTTHGRSKTRLYSIFQKMHDRCYDQAHNGYDNYGGRGILICEEWFKNFENFKDWALENGYSDELSIDRIRNDEGYYPENCRWSTRHTQDRNKSNNYMITFKGKTQCLKDWCTELDMPQNTLRNRLERARMSVEDAILTPVKKKTLCSKN